MIPGWTTATRLPLSISTIRSIAVKAIVSAPSMPAAPPDSPVPAPRGTIGTPMLAGEPDERRRPGPSRSGAPTAPGRPRLEVGASRRGGTTRDRSRRSAAAGPGSSARIASTSGPIAVAVDGHGWQCTGRGVGFGRCAGSRVLAPGSRSAIGLPGPVGAGSRRPRRRSAGRRAGHRRVSGRRRRHRPGLGRTGSSLAPDGDLRRPLKHRLDAAPHPGRRHGSRSRTRRAGRSTGSS